MKKVMYPGHCVSFSKTIAFILVCFSLFISAANAQSFYFSGFQDPAGQYNVSKPGCLIGLSAVSIPEITNPENVASESLSDYATLTTVPISLSAICTGVYRITASLNIGNLSTISASPTNSYNVGFKVSVSETIRASLVSGSNALTIVTYDGAVEKQRSAASALDLSLLQAGIPQNISFLATQSFNRVAVEVSAGLLSLASGSSIDFYYGFATSDLQILPVKLSDFSATVENKTVALNWTSALETDLAQYELQRSSDGGATFTAITTVKAKGNTAKETRYSFADGTVSGGSYIYRLKMIDKDGSAEYSKLVLVKLAIGANWKIYPTLLSSGTDLNVSVVGNGVKTQIQLMNLQGQTVRTASTTTDSKLTIATGSLPAGIYVLKLYKDGQLQASEKVVVQ